VAISDSQKNGQFLKVLPFIATVMIISVSFPIFTHDLYRVADNFFLIFIYTEMEPGSSIVGKNMNGSGFDTCDYVRANSK
jgi:hypothetical protein